MRDVDDFLFILVESDKMSGIGLNYMENNVK